MLLVTEAGGKVSTADGGEDVPGRRLVCAVNPDLHAGFAGRLAPRAKPMKRA